jgi:hypothetical protein
MMISLSAVAILSGDSRIGMMSSGCDVRLEGVALLVGDDSSAASLLS